MDGMDLACGRDARDEGPVDIRRDAHTAPGRRRLATWGTIGLAGSLSLFMPAQAGLAIVLF
jgi:hypothetical protein